MTDPARTALVLSPDSGELHSTSTMLGAAGYHTLTVSTWSAAAAAVADNTVSVLVLDDRIAREPSARTEPEELARRALRDSALRTGVPLLLLADLLDPVSYPGFRSLKGADWIAKPVGAVEIVRRVDELITRNSRERSGRMRARALRDSVRSITTAIRSTNEPQAMADVLVSGLAHTFDAPFVWFAAFQDDGVAEVTVGAQQERTSLDMLDDQACALATRLWAAGTILTVMDHPAAFPPDAESWLSEWATAQSLTAFAAIPVGDLDTVLGIILIGDARGSRAWTSIDTSLITHVAQNLAHGLMQARLITAQQHVLARMTELDRSKSDLMSTVNHELRTPLTSITGFLELVEDGEGGEIPSEAAAMLRVVDHNVRRLRGLVDDMLTMSRLEATAAPISMAPVGLDPLLTRVVESIHPFAASRGVTLAVVAGAHSPVVLGEEGQLERAFTNLIQNSVKFTPSGGTVRVLVDAGTAADGEPAALVRIVDTGIGIPAEDMPRLFTRFFRASNATAAVIPGTGLGLAIVRSLIEAHHGTVSVESTVGVGTTFSVVLPLSPLSAPIGEAATPS